ncbi:hypothetical protein CVT26_006411 [Gymnopilus dilepis]|uniref:Myb/SANT-like domain-containing protein n=1 Tax=Gymnopilus dilepis TaxID=231916 RepID=A0A409Y1Y8_9AGAR|nr:hypothetical protein CVT26_006411 [Gymnopilus dilepis]
MPDSPPPPRPDSSKKQAKKAEDKAHWTLKDEVALLDFLASRSATGEGSGFKMIVFNEAAPLVNATLKAGAPKTGKSCQNKWNSFRTIYRVIQAIQARSGWTWSDETGASITPEMESQWAAFLRANPKAKPFKNKGWVHCQKMSQLMPSTLKGTHVFCPTQGTTGLDAPAVTSEPPSDQSQEMEEPEGSDEDVEEPEEPLPSLEEAVPEESSQPKTPTTPPRPSRKRERAGSDTPMPLSKRTKLNAATAIQGLTQSIDRFGDNMCKVLGGGSEHGSPARRQAAMAKALTERWLEFDDQCILHSVFEDNTKAADAYLSFKPDQSPFRRHWVGKKIRDARSSYNFF